MSYLSPMCCNFWEKWQTVTKLVWGEEPPQMLQLQMMLLLNRAFYQAYNCLFSVSITLLKYDNRYKVYLFYAQCLWLNMQSDFSWQGNLWYLKYSRYGCLQMNSTNEFIWIYCLHMNSTYKFTWICSRITLTFHATSCYWKITLSWSVLILKHFLAKFYTLSINC